MLQHGFLLSVHLQQVHRILVLMHRTGAEDVAIVMAEIDDESVFLRLLAVGTAENVLMMAVKWVNRPISST